MFHSSDSEFESAKTYQLTNQLEHFTMLQNSLWTQLSNLQKIDQQFSKDIKRVTQLKDKLYEIIQKMSLSSEKNVIKRQNALKEKYEYVIQILNDLLAEKNQIISNKIQLEENLKEIQILTFQTNIKKIDSIMMSILTTNTINLD